MKKTLPVDAVKQSPVDVSILALAARHVDDQSGTQLLAKKAPVLSEQDRVALRVLQCAARKDADGIAAAAQAWSVLGIEPSRRGAVLGRALEMVASDAPLRKAVMLTSKGINDFTEISAIERCCKVLLDLGAPAEHQDIDGRTALHAAALTGAVGVMRIMLEHGVDPNLVDGKDDTPLILAAGRNDYESTRLLLRSKADPSLCVAFRSAPADASMENSPTGLSFTDVTWLIHAYGGEAKRRRHWQGAEHIPTMAQAAALAGDAERLMEVLDAAQDKRQDMIQETRRYIDESMDASGARRAEMLATIDAYAAKRVLSDIAQMCRSASVGPG